MGKLWSYSLTATLTQMHSSANLSFIFLFACSEEKE